MSFDPCPVLWLIKAWQMITYFQVQDEPSAILLTPLQLWHRKDFAEEDLRVCRHLHHSSQVEKLGYGLLHHWVFGSAGELLLSGGASGRGTIQWNSHSFCYSLYDEGILGDFQPCLRVDG